MNWLKNGKVEKHRGRFISYSRESIPILRIKFYIYIILILFLQWYNKFVILRGAYGWEELIFDPWPDLGNASEGIILIYNIIFF